ncbi:hypothetical protein AcV7_004016 [Taiwanofungus camphoratus]|nr:hypothetical protein AcV7_004016 [Antrodia cinnamomea]
MNLVPHCRSQLLKLSWPSPSTGLSRSLAHILGDNEPVASSHVRTVTTFQIYVTLGSTTQHYLTMFNNVQIAPPLAALTDAASLSLLHIMLQQSGRRYSSSPGVLIWPERF